MATDAHNSSAGSLPVAVVMVLAIGVLPAIQLHRLAESVGFSPRLLAHAFKPGAGYVESLPGAALEGLALLAESGSQHYALSDRLQSDALFQQRMQEGAYPIRTSPSSNVRLFHIDEPRPAGCRQTASSRQLVLHVC